MLNIKTKRKIALLTFCIAFFSSIPTVLAKDSNKNKEGLLSKKLDAYTVLGSADARSKISGSATIVDKKSLEKFKFSDVNRALREVTGVISQEEDGYGLRPNIAIRGGRSNRSADITLMEDGVLMSPAPYSAPEAYYFPQMERMESLEVIKGAGAVKYGPRTTNGILNMVTKQIPESKTAELIGEYGNNDRYRYGITAGDTIDNYGLMVNAFHKQTSGFKDIDAVGGDTGFNVDDILTKFRITTPDGADIYQDLELKFGYYNEVSNETYLGLTREDFSVDPYRRYASSQLDQMNAEAYQMSLNHYLEISSNSDLKTSVYYNEVARSWYKLDGLTVGGTRRSISTVLNDTTTYSSYVDALRSYNTTGGTFYNRDNNREYKAHGIQSAFSYDYQLFDLSNKLEVGARIHADSEDRMQRDDRFDLVNGVANITSIGAMGSAGNRVQSANAFSTYIQNKFSYDKLDITPGLRYENINLKRKDYGSSDPSRSGSALTVYENNLDVFIPGIGTTYNVSDEFKVFAGIHKGFAPPGVPQNVNEAAFSSEEESINYEVGSRYETKLSSVELVGFLTDYKNLLGRDTFSSGGSGSGDAFNGGNAEAKGIEFTAKYDASSLVSVSDYNLPLAVNYTLTKSEFKNSFSSSFEEWGNVVSGDKLPYTPLHQIYLSAGVENELWGVAVSAKYVDEMRTVAGRGVIPDNNLINDYWTVDLSGEYKINKKLSAYANIENILDETYISADRPAGVRPGLPFSIFGGLKFKLY